MSEYIREWANRNYRTLMLLQMLIELGLVGVIAVFEILSYYKK